MKRFLFFDIDGTLVSFTNHKIPESAIYGLTLAKEKGAGIYIATGRPYSLINNIEEIKHLVDGYITANGAYCFSGNQVISCCPIPMDQVTSVIELSDKMGFACMIVGEQDIMMYNNNRAADHIFKDMLNVPKVGESTSLQTILGQRILQLTPVVTPMEEQVILPLLSNVVSSRWCPEFIDITAKGVDKAKGMKDMITWYGIPLSRTVAFGDGGNNLPMIREARIGVVMGNASQTMKAAADHVTNTVDDDGIYQALKYRSDLNFSFSQIFP